MIAAVAINRLGNELLPAGSRLQQTKSSGNQEKITSNSYCGPFDHIAQQLVMNSINRT